MLIVLTTVAEKHAADVLAEMIVEARLAACVQILPQLTSIYVWEGAIQREPEHLLLIKTLPEKWEELRDFISKNHRYAVPEIIAIEAASVAAAYLEWAGSTINRPS